LLFEHIYFIANLFLARFIRGVLYTLSCLLCVVYLYLVEFVIYHSNNKI